MNPIRPTAAAESESFSDDLLDVVPALPLDDAAVPTPSEPGTDGEFISEPTGPDDDDAEWAARNLNIDTEGGWGTLRPDPSDIALYSVSSLDHHFDAMHADSLDYPGDAPPW